MARFSMDDSIMDTVKLNVGLPVDYDPFDISVLTSINSSMMVLNQLGIGPSDGFTVTGRNETWGDFLGDDKKMLQTVVLYVSSVARINVDPPANASVLSALNETISQYEWRLMAQKELINLTKKTSGEEVNYIA